MTNIGQIKEKQTITDTIIARLVTLNDKANRLAAILSGVVPAGVEACGECAAPMSPDSPSLSRIANLVGDLESQRDASLDLARQI